MKLKALLVSVMSLFSLTASPLEKGAKLPALKGMNQEGKEVTIQAADGHEWVLIFTFPKALTPG